MNKPLSETHPTLFIWFERQEITAKAATGLTGLILVPIEEIQSCCVDVAEHERVRADLVLSDMVKKTLAIEVERLKKELDLWNHTIEQKAFARGLVEGERRTMQRVKEAIATQRILGRNKEVLYHIEKELDIGEEEIVIKDGCNKHYHCNGNNCKDSDNNNYTNKGAE